MGGYVADFNGDGLLDHVFSEVGMRAQRMSGELNPRQPSAAVQAAHPDASTHLLLRKPDGTFQSVGGPAGIAVPVSATGLTMVSWTPRPLDVDAGAHGSRAQPRL